jgi:hypothetical protein
MDKLLVLMRSRGGLATLMFASIVATAGCGGGEQTAADFRCRLKLSDGTCNSLPADCPTTVFHSNSPPRCPMGAELIPIEEDDCAHMLICID